VRGEDFYGSDNTSTSPDVAVCHDPALETLERDARSPLGPLDCTASESDQLERLMRWRASLAAFWPLDEISTLVRRLPGGEAVTQINRLQFVHAHDLSTQSQRRARADPADTIQRNSCPVRA
jgi:hypothetical protein